MGYTSKCLQLWSDSSEHILSYWLKERILLLIKRHRVSLSYHLRETKCTIQGQKGKYNSWQWQSWLSCYNSWQRQSWLSCLKIFMVWKKECLIGCWYIMISNWVVAWDIGWYLHLARYQRSHCKCFHLFFIAANFVWICFLDCSHCTWSLHFATCNYWRHICFEWKVAVCSTFKCPWQVVFTLTLWKGY